MYGGEGASIICRPTGTHKRKRVSKCQRIKKQNIGASLLHKQKHTSVT
jgi:hypothetical protein